MKMIPASPKIAFAIVLSAGFLCAAPETLAQGAAGAGATYEPRMMIDMPTAGMLDKGSFAVDLNFYQEGGVLFGLSAGIFERLSFGIAYGGSRLIGGDEPTMNSTPGVNVKLRILEESAGLPALAIGFDSQGKDGYLKDLGRYAIKSPGFFAVGSKNYTMMGFLSLHGGVNYSLERGDDDKDVNFFFGAEKTLGPFLSFVAEYNLGVNDSDRRALGKGRGYLNGAVTMALGGGLTLGVNFKDILKNGKDVTVANRTVRMEYIAFF